jgi:flagellar hook-length control protein FliK
MAAAGATTTEATPDSSTDSASKKRHDSIGSVGSPADGDPSRTRMDRPHASDGIRPTTHHDAGTSRTEGRESNVSLSQTDRVRLVQRVARAVQTAQERGGELKLRLSPPELGSLRLQVRLNDGALTARIETETPAARQALTDGLPALRDRLAEQNIRVERFDVDLFNSGGGASQMPQQQYDQGGDGPRYAASGREAQTGVAAESDAQSPRGATPIVADDRLNVIV